MVPVFEKIIESVIIILHSGNRSCFAGGGFNISPLKSRHGRPRTQVQHLMQIDLKGWGVGYLPSFQQHCLLHMLNSVAGTALLNHILIEIIVFQAVTAIM